MLLGRQQTIHSCVYRQLVHDACRSFSGLERAATPPTASPVIADVPSRGASAPRRDNAIVTSRHTDRELGEVSRRERAAAYQYRMSAKTGDVVGRRSGSTKRTLPP